MTNRRWILAKKGHTIPGLEFLPKESTRKYAEPIEVSYDKDYLKAKAKELRRYLTREEKSNGVGYVIIPVTKKGKEETPEQREFLAAEFGC